MDMEHWEWCLSGYRDDGLSGQRIAIVGHSHWSNDPDHDGFTDVCLRNVISGDWRIPFSPRSRGTSGLPIPLTFGRRCCSSTSCLPWSAMVRDGSAMERRSSWKLVALACCVSSTSTSPKRCSCSRRRHGGSSRRRFKTARGWKLRPHNTGIPIRPPAVIRLRRQVCGIHRGPIKQL